MSDEDHAKRKSASEDSSPERDSSREHKKKKKKKHGSAKKSAFEKLSTLEKHQKLMRDYKSFYGAPPSTPSVSLLQPKTSFKNDFDVLEENHQFLWDEDEVEDEPWERKLAKRYYEKLFKEYCLADLSRYRENMLALRWRTEQEVLEGKGQFVCGSLHCDEREELESWEVDFHYREKGESKSALVKVRLCPRDSKRLHHARPEPPAKKESSSKHKKSKKHKHSHAHEDEDGIIRALLE